MEIFQALNDYALYTTPASRLEILLSGSKEGMEESESFTGKKKEALPLLSCEDSKPHKFAKV